jgi:type I restriction enzyme R subunit
LSQQPRSERKKQNRVIALSTDKARPDCQGYHCLGEWHKQENNRCIEENLLRANLKKLGYSKANISAALQKLLAAAVAPGVTLYQANLRTYQLLRSAISASWLRSPARWSSSFNTFAAPRPILRDRSRPSRCGFPFTSP